MMRVRLSGFALPLTILVALAATGIGGPVTPPRAASLDVLPGETILTFPAADPTAAADPAELRAAVALPDDATTARAVLLDGRAGDVAVVGDLMRARGRAVALIAVRDPGDTVIRVAVRHDGDWAAKRGARLASATFDATLPGAGGPPGLKAAAPAAGGSYVIVTGPQYASALAPLVDWKTRKGWPVVLATTDEVGVTNEGIRDWLRDAYETWEVPPEHVLLVGDVADIPTWNFSGNVTDLPYQLLDGDDWLPDLMLGRFSVSNQSECQAMVAKSVAYEQTPHLDDTTWFTRSVMVAGQYASTTPMHTVRFCGEQLAGIGFDELVPVTPVQLEGSYIVSPFVAREGIGIPQNLGPEVIKDSIDRGCGYVVYRGWAYGTAGWEPPHYTVDEIPTLANGAMTPIVMSFVCLNGDFAAAEPCFGEVFTRTGGATAEEFKGAVAFIGNGEHWSHTRFNDAMAISVFERITDPTVTNLGGLLNAGKMRFLEYYPGELDDTGDEESVEFYFHIYLLLGDPELTFHRAVPAPLDAAFAADQPVGATYVEVAVTEEDGATPRGGARVGIAQGGQLLGRALTDDDGTARIVLDAPLAAGPVDVTASHPDRLPFRGQINAAASGVFIGLTDLGLDDGGDDGTANPGEALALLPTLRNDGTEDSGSAVVNLAATGPVTVDEAAALLDPIAAGATGQPQTALAMTVDPAAEDGSLVTGQLAVEHGAATDRSGFTLAIAAPDLHLSAVNADGDPWLEPGGVRELTVTVANRGSRDTAGGTLQLTLAPLDGVVLETASVTFGGIPAGGGATCGPVTLSLHEAVATGRSVVIHAEALCDEGAAQARSLTVPIGRGDVSEPAGPDAYGYHAYDSADWLYPDQRPVYHWRELSPTYGGPGTQLEFDADNYDTDVAVDLPFSFTFYGESFDRIRVSDNGWVSFQDADDYYNFYNWTIPSSHGSGAVVAPFWDNLTPEPSDDPESDPVGVDSDGVYWYHDAAAGEFVLEWSRMRHVKPEITDLQTFQMVLRDPSVHATPTGDGEILFLYKQVADNDHMRMYATVGIESPDETDGLQLTYDGVRGRGTMAFGPGQAIRLTTAPPVRMPYTVASLARRDTGGRVDLQWRVDDPRPVLGWRVHARTAAGTRCLTDTPLPAEARAVTVDGAGCDLVLEALLPHGGRCEAGKALVGDVAPAFALRAPVPNPLRGEASIAFSLPRAGHVSLRVYDVRGRLIRTLLDDEAAAGEGLVVWRGRDASGRELADGVYFCRLEHAGRSLTQKVMLVR